MFLCVNLVEILFHTLGYLLRLSSVRNKPLMSQKYPSAITLLTHTAWQQTNCNGSLENENYEWNDSQKNDATNLAMFL